ncbi:Electron transport protein HydN [Vibrio aerogenes CECT 7868]|uniref:Electron transport protein HydN n=1 Tax=Vibrio aerogenes CECT 7868 TaxID=1216006 RepID=A0A1M5YNL0_9VIBR|nr:4Fe-4S dicluster domain-containing protein [Vibrio aerogenes]SHI13434.1 Electron transport protein HydN [Vibrio aerogenes CECT 7868]
MNRFIFADANKCIGCRTCELACAISHQNEDIGTLADPKNFTPRLSVIKNAQVTVPVMCRQCDDAPCAQVCPNNAIVHEDGYIKVIQSRCIGCKTCAIACPYGAMNIETTMVENHSGYSGLFQRKTPQSQAVKCDLCSHSEAGPACVQVCPTQAIKLMVPEEVELSTQQKREAAATSASVISV